MILAMSGATSPPLRADIDKIWIFVAIALGSIIVEWLNKRKQPGDTNASKDAADSLRNSGPTTSRPGESSPTATSDWEEELRRLLRGDPPVAKPPSMPSPQPSPAPPPVRPVVIQAPRPAPPPSPGTGAPPIVRSIPAPLAGTVMAEAEKSVEVQLPSLKESVTAYQRASHLQEQVVERLRHVEEITVRHQPSVPTAHRAAVSPEAVRSIAFIRDRHTVRQAIVAGLVFGAPKALENE